MPLIQRNSTLPFCLFVFLSFCRFCSFVLLSFCLFCPSFVRRQMKECKPSVSESPTFVLIIGHYHFTGTFFSLTKKYYINPSENLRNITVLINKKMCFSSLNCWDLKSALKYKMFQSKKSCKNGA